MSRIVTYDGDAFYHYREFVTETVDVKDVELLQVEIVGCGIVDGQGFNSGGYTTRPVLETFVIPTKFDTVGKVGAATAQDAAWIPVARSRSPCIRADHGPDTVVIGAKIADTPRAAGAGDREIIIVTIDGNHVFSVELLVGPPGNVERRALLSPPDLSVHKVMS